MMKTPRLEHLWPQWNAKNHEEQKFTCNYDALTPTVMEDKDAKHYAEALNFACHKSDIRNIAVTGPYGAGKSSVLLTWTNSHKDRKQIMTVSLADFDMVRAGDVTSDKNGEDPLKSERKVRQEEKSIEYSILQQILYKARKSDLPYSRIDRIADFTTAQVWARALYLLEMTVFCLSGLILLFPNYFRKKLSLPVNFSEFLLSFHPAIRTGLAGFAFFITFYLLISKLHRMGIFDRRLSIDRIDLSKGATLSTRPADPSLLNVFIDEIVYFFDKKKYKVVIFEDLDRHNDGAIFIKLREINQIINNSLSDERPVRFIYAVREDIFTSTEARTKFFDFIIPVIPVMDSQNASEHFSAKFKQNELDVAGFEQCVARIAIFIPDMRVLNSITNEFRLYRNLVNDSENITRLLSLIAYKNLCARDYHLIDVKQGILYGVINAYVSGDLKPIFEERIDIELQSRISEISQISGELAKNKSEIIRDILQIYISDKTQRNLYFSDNTGKQYDFESVINSEALFTSMLNTPGLQVRFSNGYSVVSITKTEVDNMLSEYERRCELLNAKSDGKLSETEKRMKQLRQLRRRLQVARPKSLIDRLGSKGFRTFVNDSLHIECNSDSGEGYTDSQLDFIYSLLRWGYLSTDYMSYRSVFIPGSLSSNDNDFIRAVSAGKENALKTGVKLNKIANVVAKLKELGLILQDNAWHAGVLLYLLKHDQILLREIIQIQLEEGEEHRLELLYKEIFCNWPAAESIAYAQLMASDTDETAEFMSRLMNMSDKKSAMSLLVLLFCSSELRWNKETTDMQYVADRIFCEHGDIPDMVPKNYAVSFTENLKRTRVMLSRIGDCKSEQGREIVSILASLDLLRYSKDNILNIVSILSGQDGAVCKQFLKEPFSTLETFGIPQLNKTVNQNINNFITDFFISSDEFGRVPSILNNPALSVDKIQNLARAMSFLIPDISKINERNGVFLNYKSISAETSVYTLLLENDRIDPTWLNVHHLLNFSDELNPWLAIWFERNYDKITDIPDALSSLDIYENLIDKIYASGTLNNPARLKILSAIKLMLLSLPETLTADQARLLVENGRLAPVRSVYQQLFTAFHDKDDQAVSLRASLVLQNPKLLESDPEFILINNGDFSPKLTKRLLTSKELPDSILVSTLQWLWGYDPEFFKGLQFIDASTLIRLLNLSSFNDGMILCALLAQSLRAAEIAHDVIAQVLGSLGGPVSQAFISDLNHRSIDMTGDELELARLLESAGFIRSLKEENKEGRYRFIPHNSPAFRRD